MTLTESEPVPADSIGPLPVVAAVPEVDGIPVSGLLSEVPDPRAVVVALHGGAVDSRYFDCPGHPEYSLLRTGQRLGYTVLALDRPGFRSSAPYADLLERPERRVELIYGAVDALLDGLPRGAGVFLLAHSAGCELAVRMAAATRGAELLGLELAGTGREHQQEAHNLLWGADRVAGRRPRGVGRLIWEPARLYPENILGGGSVSASGSHLESRSLHDWARAEFLGLAPDIPVPVRYSLGEYERVWRNDPAEMGAVGSLFTGSPRVVVNRIPDTGHNVSLGRTAPAYHLDVLAFTEECIIARRPGEFSGPTLRFDGGATARPER
ncbi:alpha/beta hydrolase [Nocardia jinanensis]|uniref:alpha/beta hydrolase n=1 Tax=Nocardia jinanensis TaxID=382504 RepID=UPI0007389185|nr:alpha/beta hydrolase [Nocardia jinanensis]